MALREVLVDGAQWVVWPVQPAARGNAPTVRPDMMGGWLAAKCGSRSCRIIPIPENWQSWTEERLANAVREAASAVDQRER